MPRFTKTEQALLRILKDGNRHTREELIQVFRQDNLDNYNALRVTICGIRKKIRPLGEDILCEFNMRRIHYRQVRLISYEG